MIAIPLENLKPDDVYPNDVLDEQGAVLVPASTPISIELLQWMRNRRVVMVYTKERTSGDAVISEATQALTKSKKLKPVDNPQTEDQQKHHVAHKRTHTGVGEIGRQPLPWMEITSAVYQCQI